MISYGRYLFADELVSFRRMKTHSLLYISETEGNSSNLEILVKCIVGIEIGVMCHISCLFKNEFLDLRP